MDCKLINRQQLPASRWQQDDTPCFVPFPNQSIKYWITTLLIAMMSMGVGATDVTYDPDSYNGINQAGSVCNVTLSRTLYAGKAEALFLPFSVTKEQLDATFTSGYDLWQYSSISNGKFTFTKMGTPQINAATPYIIVVKETNAVTPVFSGVTVASNCNEFGTQTTATTDDNYLLAGYYYKRAWYDVIQKQSPPYTGYFITNGNISSTDLRNDGIDSYAGGTFCLITKDGQMPS